MVRVELKIYLSYALIVLGSGANLINGQSTEEAFVRGQIKLDSSWESKVYLSYLPTFEDRYAMSGEMIIAETQIDSSGNFEFDISFLPEDNNLYRLHLSKKGDSPTTIVIGGKDENHLFFLANRHSKIGLKATSTYPPFKHVVFINSSQNKVFQEITNLVYDSDSIASESGLAKRQFIENKRNEELLAIADTTANPLIALYAVYSSEFENNLDSNIEYYTSFQEKWKNQENSYFRSFSAQMPERPNNYVVIYVVLISLVLISLGYGLGKVGLKKKGGIEKLSVQERKIYEALQQGASNQEISDQYNIGISTVKSHVSNIFAKMNVKSRKDLMNLSR